jgi:hypothetical protein
MKYLKSKISGASRDNQEISSTLHLSLFVGGHISSFAEANLKKIGITKFPKMRCHVWPK